MARLTGVLQLGLGLVLALFGLVADRALAERARREREAARTAADETARLSALSVRAALAQVEQSVVAQRPASDVALEILADPPGLTAGTGFVPYSTRPRVELARLLASTRTTPNGLPEAVVARLALGDTPVSLGTERPPDVGERLLSGRLPVRPGDLRPLAARLGIGGDPRVTSLADRLRRAPASGVPSLPEFLRSVAPGEKIEGWTRANGMRLHYTVALASLCAAAGVAPRLLTQGGASAGVDASIETIILQRAN